MKGIIVVDIPEKCLGEGGEKCPFCFEGFFGGNLCIATKIKKGDDYEYPYFDTEDVKTKRPDWCPIKSIPEKRDGNFDFTSEV